MLYRPVARTLATLRFRLAIAIAAEFRVAAMVKERTPLLCSTTCKNLKLLERCVVVTH